jgi:hypothetical protein
VNESELISVHWPKEHVDAQPLDEIPIPRQVRLGNVNNMLRSNYEPLPNVQHPPLTIHHLVGTLQLYIILVEHLLVFRNIVIVIEVSQPFTRQYMGVRFTTQMYFLF